MASSSSRGGTGARKPWMARLFGSATIGGPEHNGPAHGAWRAKEEGLIRDEPGDVVVARWQPRLDRFDIVTKNTRFEFEDEEPCFVLEPRGEGLCASTYRLRPAAERAGMSGGKPARALSGFKRPREEDEGEGRSTRSAGGGRSMRRPREEDEEEEGRRTGEPEEEIAAGGSALEQLPDEVVLRIMEFVDVVGACRMRAASRRLRALIASRMPPLREALLDLTGFKRPEHALDQLLARRRPRDRLPSVVPGTPSVQLSLRAELESDVAHRLFTLAMSALEMEVGASLEMFRLEVTAGCRPRPSAVDVPTAPLFRPFAKLRALALPRALRIDSRMAVNIAAYFPSLKTLELCPEDAPAISALAPLALERLAVACNDHIGGALSQGLLDVSKGPACASLRVLSFRPPPSTPSSEADPFDPPPAVTLSGSAARAISGFANLERVEGYIRFKLKPAKRQSRFQRRANSDNDERRPSDAVHVASLARMPKMTSLQVRFDLEEEQHAAWRHVLEGLAEGARANPALRLDLFLSAQGPDTEDEATAGDPSGAVEALIEAAPDSLRRVALAWPAPLHGGVAAALARLGPGTRSLRLAHAVDSLRELRAHRAFQGMARPSPVFEFGVHVAAPRRGLLEMARADLEVYLPPFATRSFSIRSRRACEEFEET
eukprot:tig00000459_g1073.t1